MSETGATQEQIEAAARRWANAVGSDDVSGIWSESMRVAATYLVPPDQRIVEADDLAVMERVVEVARAAKASVRIDDTDMAWFACTPSELETQIRHLTDADLDRIAALVEGS